MDKRDVNITIVSDEKEKNINVALVRGEKGESGYTPKKGIDYFTNSEIEEIKEECTYNDMVLSNRVTALEETVGTLNDSLEVVLNGNE